MILDHIKNLPSYHSLHPDLSKIIEIIFDQPDYFMVAGRYPIGDLGSFLIIEEAQGRGLDKAVLETHRRFIDLQLCLKGEDKIGWKPLHRCSELHTPYDEVKDIAFYDDSPDYWTLIDAQEFAWFYPWDAHAPLGGEGPLLKAVFKLAI